MENIFKKRESGYSISWDTIRTTNKGIKTIHYDFTVSFSDDCACTIISTIDGVKELYTLDDNCLKVWFDMLEARETLPQPFVEGIRESDAFNLELDSHAPHEFRLVTLYRHVLTCIKEESKKSRFEASGIKFSYKGVELRFKPVYCSDEHNEFVLFKTIDGNGTCYLKKVDGKCAFGLYGKGGRNSVLKKDLIENNEGLLKALFNDLTNGMTWETLLSLCAQVTNFSTCTVPKVLR